MQALFSTFNETSRASRQRACVFSHFDQNNQVAPYVFNYLNELRNAGLNIIMVSTSSKLRPVDVEELKKYCSACILRENKGYDFGSYKIGIEFLENQGVTPSSILIANDSVFGPFFSIKELLDKHFNEEGMVGLTDSYDHGYHLQSYFIHFGGNLVTSSIFKEFWSSVGTKDQNNEKTNIIMNYEVGGTKFFRDRGEKIKAIFPFEEIAAHSLLKLKQKLTSMREPHSPVTLSGSDLNLNLNATHKYWDLLIERGFPFIKRELLTRNPIGADIEGWPHRIIRHTNYNLSLIADALFRLDHISRLYDIRLSEVLGELKQGKEIFSSRLFNEFQQFGLENSIQDVCQFRFNEDHYLNLYPDVAKAVSNGAFASGQQHYLRHGFSEERHAAFVITD